MQVREGKHHMLPIGWSILQKPVPRLDMGNGRTLDLQFEIPIKRRTGRDISRLIEVGSTGQDIGCSTVSNDSHRVNTVLK